MSAIREHWQVRYGRPDPKIIGVGLNYHDHAAEQGVEPPRTPLLFAKLPNSLCGHGDTVLLPDTSHHVDAEAELAIVIGARASGVSRRDALTVVDGYTCANDVTARDIQFAESQWLRAKSFDSFCPILSTVVPPTELGNGSGLRITQRLNDHMLQESVTSNLIFGVEELIAYISSIFTLEPGDIILTGTPAGVGIFREPTVALTDGDSVEIEIEGIGVLRNTVRANPIDFAP